ncbi:MAG: hypothetical protein ABI579_05535 [Candidatus Sumerlaeota bacterium]
MADSSHEPKKKRGRPKKGDNASKPTTAKQRGRPRKNNLANATGAAAKRKRGRPRKNHDAIAVAPNGPPRRKRGRPPKIAQDFGTHRGDKRRSAALVLLDHSSPYGNDAEAPSPRSQNQLGELKSGLEHELDVFLAFLPAVLDKLRIRFERRIEALRSAMHKHAKEAGGDHDKVTDELTAAIQKAAGRLASFRAEGNHGAADIARLAKRLDRVLKRLGNDK